MSGRSAPAPAFPSGLSASLVALRCSYKTVSTEHADSETNAHSPREPRHAPARAPGCACWRARLPGMCSGWPTLFSYQLQTGAPNRLGRRWIRWSSGRLVPRKRLRRGALTCSALLGILDALRWREELTAGRTSSRMPSSRRQPACLIRSSLQQAAAGQTCTRSRSSRARAQGLFDTRAARVTQTSPRVAAGINCADGIQPGKLCALQPRAARLTFRNVRRRGGTYH